MNQDQKRKSHGQEAIAGFISNLAEMGFAVVEQAPDAETLLLSDTVAASPADDEAEAAIEIALSAVDAEADHATNSLQLYMRQMGAAKLLTREREVDIAKRIEDGLQDMLQAISACPQRSVKFSPHVVDPPVDHARDCRPGTHHPGTGTHDGSDQQDEPDRASDPVRNRRGARPGGTGGQSGPAGSQNT